MGDRNPILLFNDVPNKKQMGIRSGRTKHRKTRLNRRLIVEQLAERRVLAAITGAVFEDTDYSLQQEVGEPNLPQRLIYIDSNDNGDLDSGESYVVAEQDGRFEFPGLSDGTYLLRLFNGTQSQVQTTPVESAVASGSVSVADGMQVELESGTTLVLTDSSLVIGDLQDGSSRSLSIGNQLTKMQTLPDGTLLIVASGAGGDTSWVVDPVSQTVASIDLSGGGGSTPWSDLEIDANGRGVLLEQSAGDSFVRAVDVTDQFAGVQVTTTTTSVPADTQVITSDTGHRSVFGWSGPDGMQLSLWSNVTDSFITSTPIDVSGTSELLAFDDASGLLALRTDNGGVGVYDVDADFAQLHDLEDVTGPVAIDGARDLLMTVSPLDAMLRVINLRDGALVADLAVDLSSVGQVAAIATGNQPDSVVVLGAAGVAEVALRRPAGHSVTISGDQDPDPISFGVALVGDNGAPRYISVPQFETLQEQNITRPSPSALVQSMDPDGDRYVVVQRSEAANGTATVSSNGTVSYTPNVGFVGVDTFSVALHDGRDISTVATIEVTVNPVSGVIVDIDPVPEHIVPGQVIGDIRIIGGGNDRVIEIDDPRFRERDGDIIFIGGNINHEHDPVIPLTITITDNDSGETIEETVAVMITDQNDPIEDILPHEAELTENNTGDVVSDLTIVDEDGGQEYTVKVDDDRFEIVLVNGSHLLKLKDDVAADFEKDPVIVVNVTASDSGSTYTQAITITVIDVREQPEQITLTNDTVMELVAGAVVGDVELDDGTKPDEISLSVDDSRFEIDGSTLKLVDDQYVERANQSEIELTITATDQQGDFDPISETFIIDVIENVTPYHNYDNPYDVNHNGEVTTLDVLLIINYLNRFGPGPVGQGDPSVCYDVNADGFVTALDALLVLNEINRRINDGGIVADAEQTAEGEEQPVDEQQPNPNQLVDEEDGAEGEQIPSDQLFEEWDGLKTAPDATASNPNKRIQPLEVPSSSSSDEYADHVDQTLRMLSDDVG